MLTRCDLLKDGRFRNRVVGALVLVSLAVIFVPMILDGEGGIEFGYRGPAIPVEPDIKFPEKIVDRPAIPAVMPEAARVQVLEPGTADEKEMAAAQRAQETESTTPISEVPTPPVPESAKATEPTAVPKGAPAWAVQVGSFSSKASALLLRGQLRAKKFPAYIESVPGAGGTQYRVRVGPELQQSLAETLRDRVLKETGVKGNVVSHR